MSYAEARKAFGLSRETLSNLAKLAGYRISAVNIKKLEDEGEKAVGSRGLSPEVVAYIDYVLGIGSFEATDWTTVEKGAPTIVAGEKGTFSFISVDDKNNVTLFRDKFRYFPGDSVRLVAPTALPPVESAALFETRTRGDGGYYAKQVINYVAGHSDMPHSVGAIAYALGLDNGVVSRTVAGLIKAGKLSKVSRGVVTLADSANPPAAATVASAASLSEATDTDDGSDDGDIAF